MKVSFTSIVDATEEPIVKLHSLDFYGISASLESLVTTAILRLEKTHTSPWSSRASRRWTRSYGVSQHIDKPVNAWKCSIK